ncbi:hypothetical protein K2X33_06120 [bacterium]|nr:hypothetical protein [bacterium]
MKNLFSAFIVGLCFSQTTTAAFVLNPGDLVAENKIVAASLAAYAKDGIGCEGALITLPPTLLASKELEILYKELDVWKPVPGLLTAKAAAASKIPLAFRFTVESTTEARVVFDWLMAILNVHQFRHSVMEPAQVSGYGNALQSGADDVDVNATLTDSDGNVIHFNAPHAPHTEPSMGTLQWLRIRSRPQYTLTVDFSQFESSVVEDLLELVK